MYTWEELEQFVNNCRACPLCRTRKHPVMGRGDHKGKLMLVAEAPGSQEDLAGIPFVGPSGKVLDELLAAAQRLIDPDYRISRQHRAERMLSDGDLPSFSPASGPFQDGRSEEGFSGDWRKTAPAGEGGEWSVKRDEKKLKKIKKVLAFLRGIPYNNIR